MSNAEKVSITIKKLSDVEMIGENPRITQKNDSEKRKIKFRDEFILKCKKAYRLALANYYMRKENNLLQKENLYEENGMNGFFADTYGDKLKEVQTKKEENVVKLQEHQEKLDEIQKIKDMRDGNYHGEDVESELTPVNEVVEEPVAVEEPAIVPVNEVAEEPVAVEEPAIVPVNEVAEEPVAVEEPAIVPVNEVAEEPVVVEEPVIVPVNEVVEESVVNSNPVSLDPEVQSSLAQDVKSFEKSVESDAKDINELISKLASFGNVFAEEWKSTMKLAETAVKEYNKKVEDTSMQAVANKQKELDAAKRENSELTSTIIDKDAKIDSLTNENKEKDSQIQNLVVEGQKKDREISDLTAFYTDEKHKNEEKTAQIAELTAANERKEQEIANLRNEMKIMSEQFQKVTAMFNNFQNMMNSTMQPQESVSAVEESGPVLQKS